MFKISLPNPPSYFDDDEDDAAGPSNFKRSRDVEEMELDGMDVEDEEARLGKEMLVVPGMVVTGSSAFMRGHGTYIEEEQVISSLAGTVQRVNKLVSVKALRSRYTPEVGDLVIGRITEVAPKRWKVDANSKQDAVLMLSSVNLPGGVQRRKAESDELQMRLFFEEGDLLVAEVQALMADGAMSLHTRSLKYGKLRNGILLTIPPTQIRRLKSHFISLPFGVDLILGVNGYIWVAMHVAANEENEDGDEGFEGVAAEGVYSSKNDTIPPATFQAIALVSQIIVLLSRNDIPLTATLLSEGYDFVLDNGIAVTSVLEPEVGESILAAVVG